MSVCSLDRLQRCTLSHIWHSYNNILFINMHGHTNSNIRFIINIKSLQFIAHKHNDQKWDIVGLRSIVQFEFC